MLSHVDVCVYVCVHLSCTFISFLHCRKRFFLLYLYKSMRPMCMLKKCTTHMWQVRLQPYYGFDYICPQIVSFNLYFLLVYSGIVVGQHFKLLFGWRDDFFFFLFLFLFFFLCFILLIYFLFRLPEWSSFMYEMEILWKIRCAFAFTHFSWNDCCLSHNWNLRKRILPWVFSLVVLWPLFCRLAFDTQHSNGVHFGNFFF